ncbi:MAG: M56 family metallopeptidase [Candidatus Kerfeldbacteria bacterium]|nr:M56 family metallopeptidase [Candidatus Kerfeldbacteria bacterium]
MLRNHRRHTSLLFILLVTLGTALVVAAGVVVVRTAPVVNRLVTLGSASSLDCGCQLGPQAGQTSAIIYGSALLALSGAIILVTLLRTLLLLRRTRRFVSHQAIRSPSPVLLNMARELGLTDRIRQVEGDEAEVFCAGLLKPIIFISRKTLTALDSDELQAVMTHEQQHLIQRDPLRIFLVDVLTLAWRWIPGMRSVLGEYRDSLELAADEAVLVTSGSLRRLGSALLKLLAISRWPRRMGTAPVTFFGTNERRIDQLLGQAVVRPRRRWVLVMVLISLGFIAAVSSASARVSAAVARVDQVTNGQCREMRQLCTAPIRTWVPAMSHIELVSSE